MLKGLFPDLISYTKHHPCGTPLDPLRLWRGTCFWGRRLQWGKETGEVVVVDKSQSKSGPSSGYLHWVTSSSKLWASWKNVQRNVWILVVYTSTPYNKKQMNGWLRRDNEQEREKEGERKGWQRGLRKKEEVDRLSCVRKAKKGELQARGSARVQTGAPSVSELLLFFLLKHIWNRNSCTLSKRREQRLYFFAVARKHCQNKGGQVATLPYRWSVQSKAAYRLEEVSRWCLWGAISVATPSLMTPRRPMGSMQILDQNQNPTNWIGIAIAPHWSTD